MIKILIVIALCAMAAPLLILAGDASTRAARWAWVKAHKFAALLAFGGLVSFTLASDKPPPPKPPTPPPQAIEEGVLYLRIDQATGEAWIINGDIRELQNGEAFP